MEYLLLAPNYGSGTVEVLTEADLVAGGTPTSAWSTSSSNGYSGFAYGPDDRLYVADYSNNSIVVVDRDQMDASGSIVPAAVITNAGLSGAMGGGFDSNGSLWVGSYGSNVIYRFDGVTSATGATDLAPALTLSVDTGGGALPFEFVYDVFVDHQDNVWVADYDSGIYRFDSAGSLSGSASATPDLFLQEGLASTESNSGFILYNPISVWVDQSGTLYAGSYFGTEVTRFDNALSMSGAPTGEASAYLNTGLSETSMVTLDASGDLWVAHYDGELVELPNPSTYSGAVNVSG
ncbi:MAG: hypothetical protein R3324_11835, partial [Halobacteriales archaeon]|nr:hypothetical protein [Halobacteriales archaeon]